VHFELPSAVPISYTCRSAMSRRRPKDAGLFFLVAIGGIICVITAIVQFVSEHALAVGIFTIVVGGIAVALFVQSRSARKRAMEEENARRLEYYRQLEQRMSIVRVSDNRADYVISNDDYRRGTPREHFYRKAFLLSLLAAFDNRCASCGTYQNGVDIDHFVFSKNEGGSFAMFHREGFWVNNAVPLCQTCNRSKLDQSYRIFFTQEQLVTIFERNVEMTRRLNATEDLNRFRPALPPFISDQPAGMRSSPTPALRTGTRRNAMPLRPP
jgi:5-methylcytosine-specific restriction endonuclease McrA